jgi:quinol monooxygenase YgiN
MPYIYETSFDIETKDIDQLEIGRSMQLSIAYLKAFLANEPGFINARAMYSLEHAEITHIMFESTWEDWATLQNHRQKSPFAEDKMLHQFELKVEPFNVISHIYEELA